MLDDTGVYGAVRKKAAPVPQVIAKHQFSGWLEL
jgi:hypothetical protein